MGNEKFVSKGIKCLEEFSQTKCMNNAASKKCKIICHREDICKSAPGACGGLLDFVGRLGFKGKEEKEVPLVFLARTITQNWTERG